jgi:hypothetical protein
MTPLPFIPQLVQSIKADLGDVASKDEVAVLNWLHDKNVSAVDTTIGIAEHALSNTNFGEHMIHGTILRTLESAKPALAAKADEVERGAFDWVVQYLKRTPAP